MPNPTCSKGARGIRRYVLASLMILSSAAWADAQDQRPLLGVRRTDVDVTRDTTLDAVLPRGYVLSGRIVTNDLMAVIGSAVVARSGDLTFTGWVIPSVSAGGLTASYRIVLPAGSYRLYFQQQVFDLEDDEGAVLTVISDLDRTIEISGDRSLDISPPGPPRTIMLSGRITSAGRFPTKGLLMFHSLDGSVFAQVPFDRSYRAKLVPGTYVVMASVGDAEEYSSVFRLEEINLNASGTRDFTLPRAIELSGRVLQASGRPAAPSTVLAIAAADMANHPSDDPPPCAGRSLTPLRITFAEALIPRESTTGAYRLWLLPGTYWLNAVVELDTDGALIFPFLQRSLMADARQDFTMPTLPPFVVLSGRITDEHGQPVARASVTAFTDTLTSTPNATFSASTETDENGWYRLRLLSGAQYRVEVCPPTSSPLPPGFRVRRLSPF